MKLSQRPINFHPINMNEYGPKIIYLEYIPGLASCLLFQGDWFAPASYSSLLSSLELSDTKVYGP
jgi:hypothetical protein